MATCGQNKKEMTCCTVVVMRIRIPYWHAYCKDSSIAVNSVPSGSVALNSSLETKHYGFRSKIQNTAVRNLAGNTAKLRLSITQSLSENVSYIA
jgi:hypothetical protein